MSETRLRDMFYPGGIDQNLGESAKKKRKTSDLAQQKVLRWYPGTCLLD